MAYIVAKLLNHLTLTSVALVQKDFPQGAIRRDKTNWVAKTCRYPELFYLRGRHWTGTFPVIYSLREVFNDSIWTI